MNYYNREDKSERMGNTAIYTTDDLSANSISQYTKCSSDFLDGGFKLLSHCKGRYIILRRTGPGMSSDNFTLNEIRVFSVPNLLEGSAVIEAPVPKDPAFSPNNLIENLELRSTTQDFNAITDWDGVAGNSRVVTKASQSSCFVTTDSEMAADNDQFVYTVDLMTSQLVDGFLLIQDIYIDWAWSLTDESKFFQNYFVHVGDDPDWRNNPSCPGAPFMTIDKDGGPQSGWVYDATFSNTADNGMVWRYGTERPCNLVGRYVTIFADYSAIPKPYEIALCQFGVMGKRVYIPDKVEPVAPTFSEVLKSKIV